MGKISYSNLLFADNNQLRLGTGSDLRIYHNGSNSFIQDSGTGDLRLMSSHLKLMDASENLVLGVQAGAVAVTGTLTVGVDDTGYDVKFFGATSGRYMLWDESDDALELTDNTKIKLGDGSDFQFYHSGTNSFITNTVGDINIINQTDGQDIKFQADDGSGGDTTYLQIDGGNTDIDFHKNTHHLDNVYLKVGSASGGDLQIYHNGSHSLISNQTGNLYIRNQTNDGDIIIQGDDGSGGDATYITVDGSATQVKFDKNARFNDSVRAEFGSSGDFVITHDGTDSKIENATGDLKIRNFSDDKDIIFENDNGAGGSTTYFKLDGSLAAHDGSATTALYTVWPDNSIAAWGTGADLRIEHTGSTASIFNTTGHLQIINYADDSDIIFKSDDGSGGVETYFYLDGSASSGNPVTVFPDQARLQLGTDTDLWIYSDGSNSYLYNNNGDLKIQQAKADKDLILLCDDGSGGETAYITLDGSDESVIFGKAPHIPEYILHVGDGNTYFGFAADDTFRVGVGGTQRLNIATGIELTGNTTLTGTLTVGVDDTGYDVKFFGATSGSFLLWDESDDSLELTDNTYLKLGDSGDFKMWHDGSNTFLSNEGVGHVNIQNTADDKDIIFKSDDGSGATTEYLRFDGGSVRTVLSKELRAIDNVNIKVGDGGDLGIYHNGTNSYIVNGTGNLEIVNNTDDGDIKFQTDDGSGSTTTYITIDGGAETTIFSKPIRVQDSTSVEVGSGADLQISHNGTNSSIINYVGELNITNTTDDSDINFACDDGSGGTTTYLTLDGSLGYMQALKSIRFADSVKAFFGDSNDLEIQHTGSATFISNYVGDFYIDQNTDDGDIIFRCDDGSGGLATYMSIDGGGTDVNFFKDSHHIDNVKAKFGSDSSGDTQIYNDGSNFYIDNTTGDQDIIFKGTDGSSDITALTLDMSDAGKAFFNTRIQTAAVDVSDSNAVIYRNSNDLALITYAGYNIELDSAGDITLDAAGNDVLFKDAGTHIGTINMSNSDLSILSSVNDKDIIFKGKDNSSDITALTLDMSDAGTAIFNHDIKLADNNKAFFGGGTDLSIYHDGSNSYILHNGDTGNLVIQNSLDDTDIILKCDDGSGGTTAYLTLDGSNTRIDISKFMRFADGVEARFGAQSDLQVHHDGSNSYITQNGTGDLYIKQMTTDEDLVFQCDDGAGGDATYFFLDGSQATHDGSATTALATVFPDNSKIHLGSGSDGRLWHDGSDTYLQNTTGDLIIQNFADDKDIIFKSDDGSGGTAEYFKLDGASVRTTFFKQARFDDSVELRLGTSGDVAMFHDGSNSHVENKTGNLTIRQEVDDGDIIFKCDDGSGGDTAYLTIDGSITRNKFHKNLHILDNVYAEFGGNNDLRLVHDGTNSEIDNATGDLIIKNRADDGDILFQSDDGSGGLTDYVRIDGANSVVTFSKDFKAGDNVKANFGAASDLQIYHSGTQSYIDHTGTGNLYLRTPNGQSIYLQDENGQALAQFTDGGGSFLYHNASLRLSTTSAGITVGGGLIVADDGTIGSESDTDAISIDDSGVVTFSSRIKANVREFEVASGSAGDAKGDIVYFGSTTSMTAGSIYHYKSDGTWELADASAVANCDGLLAVALGAASNTNGMLLRGMATLSADPGAVGDVLFVSETAGRATATAPTTNNAVVRVVGYCLHATNGNIWFNPDGTFVEVTA